MAVGALVLLALAVVRPPRRLVDSLVAAPVVFLYAYTGAILPDDQWTYWLVGILRDLLGGIPVVGDPLVSTLFATHQEIHYALVALGVAVLSLAVARTLWWRTVPATGH